MKSDFFSLAFLNFFALLVCAPTNIGEIDHHLQKKIADYLDIPQKTLGSVNENGRQTFKEIYPLKVILNERISCIPIPELEDVDENEPEFKWLLKLSCFAKNPSHFYQAVFEDVIRRKIPYNNLYGPLINYLDRSFAQQSTDVKFLLSKYKAQFKVSLLKHYRNIGDHLSAFDIVKDKSSDLISWYSEITPNAKVYEMFKENPENAESLKSALHLETLELRDWIFGCIIYDAPESFYADIFNLNPEELLPILFNSIKGMLIEIPEKEFSRINQQLKSLVRSNGGILSSFFNLITDIRYDPEYQNIMTNLSLFDDIQIFYAAKVALAADKMNLFYQIYSSNEDLFRDNFDEMLEEFLNFYNVSKQFLIIFEILNCATPEFITEILENPNVLQLLVKYYAIKYIKLEDGHMIVDLVAPDNLLHMNFPSFIRVSPNISEIYPNEVFGAWGIDGFWPSMKVTDETTCLSFLSSYEKLRFQNKRLKPSYDVIKLIASSSTLTSKIITMRITFEIEDRVILDLFNHVPNTRRLNQIISTSYIPGYYITYLNTEKQLKNFEEFTEKTVADHFLTIEKLDGVSEFDYFKWRFAFKYWINGNQRHEISKISSQVIKDLLKKEFHDEMNEIFNK